MTKAQIRLYMKNERNILSSNDQRAFNNAIHTKLFDLEEYNKSSILLSYLSFQAEVDTLAVIDQALEQNKQVFAPRVEGKNMDFYKIHNTETLIRSKFGILEPKREEENRFRGIDEIKNGDTSPNHLDNPQNWQRKSHELKLMLLPGLAFDSSGNRIGYGAGYYDRYLVKYSKDDFLKIALAYDFQLLELIHSEDHDIKADMIITPTKIIHCR